MSNLQPPTGNTRRLGGGPTSGVGAGVSRRSGNLMGTRTRKTAGMTTSGTGREPEDNEYVTYLGQRIYVKPKPLMIRHSERVENQRTVADRVEGSQSGASQQALDSQKSQDPGQDQKASGEEKKKTDDTKEKKSIDGTSQLTSSLVDGTSDDEMAKKKAEAEAKKQKSKQLTPAQLEEYIDIELKETNTLTLLMIPGIVVNNDTDEERVIIDNNQQYAQLKQNKIGSDLYNQRGSQTLNPAQKHKQDNHTGFTQESKEIVATKWSIDDASRQQKLSESKIQEIAYKKSIQEIMTQKLKQPNSLFDAESLASHISIMTSNAAQSESRASSNKNPKSGSKGSKLNSSKSGVKQSRDDATSDQNSNMSGSQAEAAKTSQGITSTVGGDNKTFKAKDVTYVEEELPASMIAAIRIIERLLTQLQFHEQQVLYKAYPSADIQRGISEEEEEAQKNQNNGLFSFGGGAEKKEEANKQEEAKEEEDPDAFGVTHLFKFKYDQTDGRQVSCMDINSVNDDLIAVGYGEYDILLTHASTLQKGILAFWTLKNPSRPEKIIYHEHSITCCAWSKTQPYLIAVGDSQGNIAIYNVRSKDYHIPIADSRDDGGKHTDIVWEVQWVDKATKGEYLVSISGDGRVIEWSMKKGLELTELTQLKRETNPHQKDVYSSAAADDKDKKGAMIFITTGGLSMDFPQGEGESGGTYFVATEEPSIHRCSVSYPDSYGQNYYGHMGPIYRIRCNPYWHPTECPVFISCSYDWTVKVWHANYQNEQLNCHQVTNRSLKDQVNDVMWSPDTSTCFASVADDGRLEIWDLKENYLNPVVTHFDTDADGNEDYTPKTVVRFTPHFSKMSPVVLTGNSKGEVDVYRTRGFEHAQVSLQDQWNRLNMAIKKDDFSADKNDKEAEQPE